MLILLFPLLLLLLLLLLLYRPATLGVRWNHSRYRCIPSRLSLDAARLLGARGDGNLVPLSRGSVNPRPARARRLAGAVGASPPPRQPGPSNRVED